MWKYFIIVFIIILIILILNIPLEARIVKKNQNPLLVMIRLFNISIYQTYLPKQKSKKTFNFKLSYLFETNLNEILKDLKDENFFVYLILEYASIKKITVIPKFSTTNPLLIPYVGTFDWMITSLIKKYVDTTFKKVKDDYYQIILLKDESYGINFEIYTTVTIFWLIVAIIKKFKVFLRLFKEQSYE